MSSAPELNASICAEAVSIIKLRHDLHAHPELGFEEERTSNLIADLLASWGVLVYRDLLETGVVGVLRGGNGHRSIGLRADIDALPIKERNTFAHASVYSGKMHACGHDGHTAMLLAAARYLAKNRTFDGTVYFVFQPAEEGCRGARAMLDAGLLRRFSIDAIFGVHNWPGLGVGQFAVREGPVFASGTKFKIVIHGRGAHAALPHNGIDPVPAACQIVQAIQTIVTRNIPAAETCVISVTMIRAGEIVNAVPETCEIQGTVRTFTQAALDLIERRMRQIAEATCQAFEAECAFDFQRYCAPTVNHIAETTFVRGVLEGFVGSENVMRFEPTMGSEDFGMFLREIPGCYFLIGNDPRSERSRIDVGVGGPCTLHSPSYDFNDALIPLGGSMWVRLVEAWFAR